MAQEALLEDVRGVACPEASRRSGGFGDCLQHLRIGEREECKNHTSIWFQRLLGDAIPAGIAPIEPETAGNAMGSCGFDGSEDYREGIRSG